MIENAKTLIEIRIAWDIGRRSGHGLWFPKLTKQAEFEAQVNDCNTWHGPGTHWIEERTA